MHYALPGEALSQCEGGSWCVGVGVGVGVGVIIYRGGAEAQNARGILNWYLRLFRPCVSIIIGNTRANPHSHTLMPQLITHNFGFYSDRSELTGFTVAALIDSKLTVIHAMIRAERNAITKIVQSIVT